MTPETVLAFDFGEKRIGVAIGNTLTRQSRPLTILSSRSSAERFEQIASLIAQWQPERLVVGIARQPDGSGHLLTRRCERFANQLEGRFRVAVARIDERYSSTEALELQREMRRAKIRKAGSGVDDLAAHVILQSYFESSDATSA